MRIVASPASGGKLVPATPTGVAATDQGTSRPYNDGQVSVAFNLNTTAKYPVTSYEAFATISGTTYSNTGASSPIVITGVPVGTSAGFRVKSTNDIGTSAQSSASTITPTSIPQAPTIGTATASNRSAFVAFTAGATGGSAITGYTVTSSPGGFTGTGASSPITVSGLTNGTAYTFTVTATNANGTSSASAASNSVTPVNNYFAIQTFNASGTFTVPADIITLGATVVGAGQRGASFSGNNDSSAGGGGGGGVIFSGHTANSGTNYTITVGTWTNATGAAGASSVLEVANNTTLANANGGNFNANSYTTAGVGGTGASNKATKTTGNGGNGGAGSNSNGNAGVAAGTSGAISLSTGSGTINLPYGGGGGSGGAYGGSYNGGVGGATYGGTGQYGSNGGDIFGTWTGNGPGGGGGGGGANGTSGAGNGGSFQGSTGQVVMYGIYAS